MVRVLHVITALELGGTEGRLANLVRATDRQHFHHAVVSMTDRGQLGEDLAAAGIEVHALNMRRGVPSPGGLFRLVRIARGWKPQIVHCWMYHANLLGLLAAKLGGVAHIAWSISNSDLDFRVYRRLTKWSVWLGARLSSWPEVIVVNAEAGRKVHAGWGYDDSRMLVIPNGFDLQVFRPDPAARCSVRKELGLSEGTRLIGLLARFDPMKDHATFLKAAGLMLGRDPSIHFLLAGEEISAQNAELVRRVTEHCPQDHVHLLGLRKDTPRLTAALDIACLSSAYGEGFPNVLGEAMACEIPCVVTDVGDCAEIVGKAGIVVAPRDPPAMADAWMRIFALSAEERQALGRAARQRIATCFPMDAITKRYEELYERLGGSAAGKGLASEGLR